MPDQNKQEQEIPSELQQDGTQVPISTQPIQPQHQNPESKEELKFEVIILRLFFSFLLIVFGYFFIGFPFFILYTFILAFSKPELYDAVVQIGNTVFYSFLLIFGLTPIVAYLNKKYNYLIKFQLGLFLLVLLISVVLIPIGIKKYNTPSDRIENPTEITVVDNILYILDEGEIRTNIDDNPRETANFIWSYKIPSGEFLSVDLSTSDQGAEKNKLIAKEPDEPLVSSNKAKVIRGDPDSLLVTSDLGIKKTYTIKFKYIEAKNNKTGKINKLSSDGEVRMWSWGKSIYYLEMKINKNQVDIHKINVNTDKVTKIDSISGSGRPQPRLYNNELYIRFESIRGEEPSESIFIFDLDQGEFIFESQVSKDYTKLYNYNQNYFFLYGPDEVATDRPDEVLMVNKKTGEVIKFTGISNAVN